MHQTAAAIVLAVSMTAGFCHEAPRYRSAIHVPDVPGYVTLRCDFHIHTVFSDGLVWPTVRSEEAWREGLDVIAITDHIEYQPHKKDMVKNHNRAFELADAAGKDLKLTVIHGSEITRSMPPGHLNAIFLTNSTPLETDEWRDAIDAAHVQGAFIFWNHPGWERQLTNGVVKWHPEHTELVEQGKLHGIEVVNGREYYPEAHRWCIEKKLTLLSNSDIHQPLNLDYRPHDGDRRPITLVFAKDRSPGALKEALIARRTVVYSGNRLIGEEAFLRPIYERSVSFDRSSVLLVGRRSVLVQIHNSSDISFELELEEKPAAFSAPRRIVLIGGKTVLLELKAEAGAAALESAQLKYRVANLLVGPDEAMKVTLPVSVSIQQSGSTGP